MYDGLLLVFIMIFGNQGNQLSLYPSIVTKYSFFFYIYRTGEPLWAETTRIIFQIILLFIFSVFLVFVIKQAIDSPNVTQTIEQSAAEVQVPGTL